jgi:hypothetical protein
LSISPLLTVYYSLRLRTRKKISNPATTTPAIIPPTRSQLIGFSAGGGSVSVIVTGGGVTVIVSGGNVSIIVSGGGVSVAVAVSVIGGGVFVIVSGGSVAVIVSGGNVTVTVVTGGGVVVGGVVGDGVVVGGVVGGVVVGGGEIICTGAPSVEQLIGFPSLSPKLIMETSIEVVSPTSPTALTLSEATVALPLRGFIPVIKPAIVTEPPLGSPAVIKKPDIVASVTDVTLMTLLSQLRPMVKAPRPISGMLFILTDALVLAPGVRLIVFPELTATVAPLAMLM